ncbi:DUF418 domain-containing protein [uncultured Alistipes sp.]|jgi:uncharacterized protein|uniref:DUF418 domain-containing protein n=1 Tax=uncultured Alistipes sp. TaxID=538949 RepID=UPI0025E7B9D0|nr:DUF418 domain-containing protein [uncultured Alistipes sp.]
MEQSLDKNPRVEVVDALRGFAVMAILLVHNLEHFIFPVYPADTPGWLNALDQGVFSVVFTLFAGKAYAIFALLFGFTFYIQSNNRRRQGRDFGYRFLWRLVLLAGFATLNAAFFPAGDVLLLFVVVGLVLFVARNWSDGAVLAAAVVFLLQPVEWYHCIAGLVNPAHRLPDLGVGEMYAQVAEYTGGGNFGEFILGNITLGQKASLLWAVNAGRFFQTAGLFLLGLWIGRKRLFISSEKNYRFWVRTLVISAVAFAPLYALKELVLENDGVVRQSVGTVFDMWQKLAFTGVLVASFVLSYRNRRFGKAVGNLRFYGKMSLTNYISQSVIGAFVYFPFGLYLAPRCGYTASLLIGILVFLLQVRCCKWWLARHKQGPLEYVWHKWTWMGTGK